MEFYFILVDPKVPENIGASARAIKTMGFRILGDDDIHLMHSVCNEILKINKLPRYSVT